MKSFLFAAALALSSATHAQLQNGDFASNGDYWSLERGESSLFAKCENSLAPDAWSSTDLIWRYDGVNNWAVQLIAGSGTSTSRRNICAQIAQPVTVPAGTRLAFEYKLGHKELYNPVHFWQDVSLSVRIESGFDTDSVFYKQGVSANGYCNSCPDWTVGTADVSQYWGQPVDLQFYATSSYQRSNLPSGGIQYLASRAWVDNVRFEPIPPNAGADLVAGNWYNPDRSGHGIHLSRSQSGDLTLVWYTYDQGGAPMWLISDVGPISGGQWSQPVYKATFNHSNGSVSLQSVGTVSIRAFDDDELMFSWSLNALSGVPSQGAERFVHLHGGASHTGHYFEPAFGGWGVTLDVEGAGPGAVAVATVFFYDAAGHPTWAQGIASGDLGQSVQFQLNSYLGAGLCPSCQGNAVSLTPSAAGGIGLSGFGAGPGAHTAISTSFGASWYRGSSATPAVLARLTYP